MSWRRTLQSRWWTGLRFSKKVKAVKRRSFERYHTDDGEQFFVEVGTEESVWDLPTDGRVVPG